jgi:hypothetical protein
VLQNRTEILCFSRKVHVGANFVTALSDECTRVKKPDTCVAMREHKTNLSIITKGRMPDIHTLCTGICGLLERDIFSYKRR